MLLALQTKMPKELGYSHDYWTTRLLGDWIEKKYKVKYKSKTSLYLLFKKVSFTYHRPGTIYKERNEAEVVAWRKTAQCKLNKLLNEQNTVILTGDEMILTTNDKDVEDHRCIVGPKREPMTLDVRLLFALPDYHRAEGKEAILRMGLLGNPEGAGVRVLKLDAPTVYFQQVQQQVRGKIRDVCISYASVEDVFKAVEQNGTGKGFSDIIRTAVGTVLAENNSPLFLVGAVVSNVKPDPSVVDAIAANQAADYLVEAMTKIDNFLKSDPSGTRAYIYKLMAVQAITKNAGRTDGSNTLFMTDVSNGLVLPVPKR